MKVLFSLLILVTSICSFFTAIGYQFWADGRPGAGFFPVLISGALIILTIINTMIDFRKNKLENDEITDDYFELKDMIVVGVMILVYMVIFSLLGYIVSTLLFILCTLFYLRPKFKIQNILVSIVLVAIIYVVFDYTLSTGLPTGILSMR